MTAKVLCFGELLFRLGAPRRELLLQSPQFDVYVGGAEANVAVGLARLGHEVGMVSRVTDNALGDAALGELRKQGVDCSRVQRGPGRMGLYFLTQGAGLRPSDIIYDRTHSAFAEAPANAFDWPALLAGVGWLHVSGITPALGPASSEMALRAVKAARAAGVRISFDGNYRPRLWEAWDGDPRAILGEIIGQVDVLFGNHRDVTLVTGTAFPGEGEERRRASAEAAFAAFPNLTHIASTARKVDDADRHRIAGRIDSREGAWQTEEVAISGIVDRIGGGDAFASGVLHGLISNQSEAEAVRTGLALTCLKHSLPGDASLFGIADIEAFHAGGLDVRR